MTYMKIVLLDADTLGEIVLLEKLNTFGDFIAYGNTMPEEVVGRIESAEVIITIKVKINKEIMDESPFLKLICVAATGMNNIDLEYAQLKGILVKNVSGYSTQSVAQQTFAMLLTITNHVNYYYNYVQKGDYSKGNIFTHVDNPIYELKDKVLGIIGLGQIGRSVASIAEAFGMKVVYASISGVSREEKFEKVSFMELLKMSDVISIHAPLTEQTTQLIQFKEMQLMKPSAILLNLGRGNIVHELDLVKALNENVLFAAALDVFENEPIHQNSPLLTIDNPEKLLLTPHVAWSSVEAREKLMEGIINNIKLFINS